MQRQGQGVVIAAVGLLLAGIQLVHATQRTETTLALLIDAVPFVLMALALAYAGYWVATGLEKDEYATIASAWTAGGAVGFAAVAALVITSLNVSIFTFEVFETGPYLAIDHVTAGALAGVLVGLYDIRSRRRLAELERQRDRVEAFANQAADVNNYGRALNQSATLEEVSSLCVEALATFVEISETAFVEGRGEFATIVDSTIIGIDDETIAEQAMRAADTEPATVVTHTDDIPAALGDDVESLLTILVSDTENATIALVAINRGQTLTDETRELLEMLVSHAGTALENIYQPGNHEQPGDDEVDIEVESDAAKD